MRSAYYNTRMKRHSVTLTEEVSNLVAAQISTGRFKDFSAAVNETLYSALAGSDAIFREYGVSPEEVERSAERTRREIRAERRKGELEPFA